jgi:hypothetical protein
VGSSSSSIFQQQKGAGCDATPVLYAALATYAGSAGSSATHGCSATHFQQKNFLHFLQYGRRLPGTTCVQRRKTREGWEKDYLVDVDALAFLTGELYLFNSA